MPHRNPSPEEICRILRKVHSIAVVGLSPNEARPSYRVARGLQSFGFRIIPVRPRHGGAEPSGAGVAASHLLPQSAGYAITSDLASVVAPSRMAITNDLAVVSGQPSQMASSFSSSSSSNVSEVRPLVNEVLGEKAFPDLESLPELPDIVDVFRASEHVPAIVESCIKLGIKYLWLQEGIVNEEAAQRAREAGITVVMDRCMWRDYMQFCEHKP